MIAHQADAREADDIPVPQLLEQGCLRHKALLILALRQAQHFGGVRLHTIQQHLEDLGAGVKGSMGSGWHEAGGWQRPGAEETSRD